MAISFLRISDVVQRMGLARSTIYLRIEQGYFPPPVSLGGRAVAWPSHEVDAVVEARIAGKPNSEVLQLVANLLADRKTSR